MEQTMADHSPVQHHVVEQPVEQFFPQENTVEEIKRTEFVPAATMPEHRPAPETVIERPEVQPVAPKPQPAPAWKMEPVALPSDLVMIETQAKDSSSYHESEAPRPARTPRPRYQPAAAPEEPLQQVETGKAGGDSA
jgi:hypothetical protein